MGIRRERFHLRVQQEEFMYPFHQIWPTVPSNRCHLLMTSLQFQTKMGVGPSGMISSDVSQMGLILRQQEINSPAQFPADS